MVAKRLQYDEIKCQRNFNWFLNNKILTQWKYVLLQYCISCKIILHQNKNEKVNPNNCLWKLNSTQTWPRYWASWQQSPYKFPQVSQDTRKLNSYHNQDTGRLTQNATSTLLPRIRRADLQVSHRHQGHWPQM